MKTWIHEHTHGIQPAKTRPACRQLRHLRMAWLFCILFRLLATLEAQQSREVGAVPSAVAEQAAVTAGKVTLQSGTCLYPVYFNYRRRQLQCNGRRLDGMTFLNMCRSIPDSSIQEQVARYDEYTAQKQKLGFGAMGSGFAGIAFFGGALGSGNANPEANTVLAIMGGACVLAVPVLAIYTSVPHQKRKAVLFRDLPVVYNAYVETQARIEDCQ